MEERSSPDSLEPQLTSFPLRPIHQPVTRELIHRGIHPPQLLLDPIHRKKNRATQQARSSHRRKRSRRSLVQALNSTPLPRLQEDTSDLQGATSDLQEDSLLPPYSSADYEADLRRFNLAYSTPYIDYYALLSDNDDNDFLSSNKPSCQQHTPSEMEATPSPKNKAWQILNFGGSKNSTPVLKKIWKGLV